MKIDDVTISKAITDRYFAKFAEALELDVALAGAGPSNLVCGMLLGEAGIKAALFECKLAPGGGMGGGGMMFNEIVVQDDVLPLMERIGIRTRGYRDGHHTADSVESCGALIYRCIQAGTRIFNLVRVEDVMFREEHGARRVSGLVLQWAPVAAMQMHVDPLAIRAKFTVDGTGHPAEVCSIVSRKMDVRLRTRTGGVVGEMSMWADEGESQTIRNAVEVYPGLYVTGMAANAVMGAPRMGPVFGGMLMSGEIVARELIGRLKHDDRLPDNPLKPAGEAK